VILVEGTAEREKLDFGSIPEQSLGRLIEPFGDVIQHGGIAVLLRAAEFVFQKLSSSAADENRTGEET
jgi:hypothetical protein